MVALPPRIDALKVDFCDFWFIPRQLDMWTELRDAIVRAVTQRELHHPCFLKNLLHVQNATGCPIWLYTSPHSGGPQSQVPATGVTAPWHDSHPYAPPLSWSRETKRGLANSMMVQFVNLFDYWVRTRRTCSQSTFSSYRGGHMVMPPFDGEFTTLNISRCTIPGLASCQPRARAAIVLLCCWFYC